jgi:hypothetical protein
MSEPEDSPQVVSALRHRKIVGREVRKRTLTTTVGAAVP